MPAGTIEFFLKWVCGKDQRVLPPTSFTIASLGGMTSRPFTLAATTGTVSFSVGAAATDDVPALNFWFLVVDQNTSVEIQGSVAANNSNYQIVGPGFGGARMTQTRVYNAAGGFAGALENIKKITVLNTSSTASNCWLVMG